MFKNEVPQDSTLYREAMLAGLARFGFEAERVEFDNHPVFGPSGDAKNDSHRAMVVNVEAKLPDETVLHLVDEHYSFKTVFAGRPYGMVTTTKNGQVPSPEHVEDFTVQMVENVYRTREVLTEITDEEWAEIGRVWDARKRGEITPEEASLDEQRVVQAAQDRIQAKIDAGTLPEWPKGTFDLQRAA